MFWLSAAYVVGMSTLSIVPALYFPASAPRPHQSDAATCQKQLDLLERELSARAAEHIQRRVSTTPDRWLHDWDGRFEALSGGCGSFETARKDLATARAVIGSLLVRYSREGAVAQQRARGALDSAAPHAAPHRPNG